MSNYSEGLRLVKDSDQKLIPTIIGYIGYYEENQQEKDGKLLVL